VVVVHADSSFPYAAKLYRQAGRAVKEKMKCPFYPHDLSFLTFGWQMHHTGCPQGKDGCSMEQIIFYARLFIAVVVNTVDALSDWLTAQGLPSWVVGIFALFGFHFVNKWSTEFAGRVEAIEKKLGIEYTPPVQKKSAWWSLLVWFVLAVYVLGKSLQAAGLVALAGIALSVFMLLLCAFGAYCFIDQAIRDHWRKGTGAAGIDR
jgi:hypothetical protein